MQAISTMRWPLLGSRPVVSVSSTISRNLPSPPFAEESDDRLQTAQGQTAGRPSLHHEIRALSLPMIRKLFFQNGVQANLGHPRAPHDTLPLHERRCRNDEHIIAPPLSTGLKQQGDVEHDERYPPST